MKQFKGLASGLAAMAWLGGCGINTPTYVPAPAPIEVGQPGGMAAGSVTVVPTFRAPDTDERSGLESDSRAAGRRVPWIRADGIALQIQYTLTNLSDKPARANLSVNGASELVSYDPEAIAAQRMGMIDEDEVILPLLQMPFVSLEPGQTKSGIIREDDLAEAALDLDALGRWMAVPEAVLVNPSQRSRAGLERVPADLVLPQFVSLKVSVASNRHVRFEVMLRIRDNDGRLAKADDARLVTMPMVYTPPAMVRP